MLSRSLGRIALGAAMGALLVGANGCFFAGAAAAVGIAASGGSGGTSRGNARPVATLRQPARSVNGAVEIRFVLRDDDEERLQVAVEYRLAGTGEIRAATPAGASGTADLEATAEGVEHSFAWNYSADLGSGANLVTIRVTPSDRKAQGTADESQELFVGNDPPAILVVSPAPAVTASATFSGTVSFEYDLADSSADLASLTAEFSVDGASFLPATTLSSLSSGLLPGRHSFVWSSSADVASSTFEGTALFRLRARDDFAEGASADVTLRLDNNATPRVVNFFDATGDQASPVLIPFLVADVEADIVDVIVQWTLQPEAEFPDLNDPSLNPFVDPSHPRFTGDSIEDPAVRAAVLADVDVRRRLSIVTESPAELRVTAGAASTLSRIISAALSGMRPMEELEGATVRVGEAGSESTATASVDGLALELSPPLPASAAPVPGAPVRILLPRVQGRGLKSSPGGALHSALWDAAVDLPWTRTVATRVTAFDSQAGPESSSVRVDRRVQGNLARRESAAVGDGPSAIDTGDLDGDGRDDLAVANAFDGSVSVLFSGSLGLFENGSRLSLDPGGHPEALAIGDLNADGRDDLVVVSPVEGRAAIFFQDASGSLPAAPASIATGAEPEIVAIGDLNDDSLEDLVIGSGPGGELLIYLQEAGTGLPSSPTVTLLAAAVPDAVLVGDLDADGLNDLATANGAAGTVTIYFQAADNTLPASPSSTLDAGNEPVSIAIGDLDGDDRADLAVANRPDGAVTVLFQGPAGGFSVPARRLSAGQGTCGAVIVDVNQDGLDDVVAVNTLDFTVTPFLRGAFGLSTTPAASIPAGEFPVAIAVGDFGGDGGRDIAVANQGESGNDAADSVVVFVSDSPGRLSPFPAASLHGSFGPEGLAIADVNGDGRADLTVVTALETIAVYYQDPVGALPATPSRIISAGEKLDSLVVGDLNSDGRNDVAVEVEDDVLVYLQASTGELAAGPSAILSGASKPEELAIGDLDGDGQNDLAVIGDDEDVVYIFLQDSLGALALVPSSSHPTGQGPDSLAIGDLNHDGRDDLIVTNADDDTVSVYLQTAAGALPDVPSLTLETGAGPAQGLIGDLNHDGLNDVAVLNVDDGTADVFFGEEPSVLPVTPSLTLEPGAGSESFSIGDLDGDGRTDLAVTNLATHRVSIYLQDVGGLTEDPNQVLPAGFAPDAQAIGDLNGDGRADLAVSNDGELGVPADNIIRVYLQE